MNYRKYFILAPGKATCRQENCPKQEVSRKQGNTSGMRFHLKKYHPDFLLEDSAAAQGSSATDGLGLSLSSLVQSSHSPGNYFDSNNPNNEAGSSATANFYAYPTNDSGFSIPMNSQNPQASSDYDVKAEIMDMLFNGSDQIDSNNHNNHPSYFDEQKSEEPIPQKRRRNDAAPTSTNVYGKRLSPTPKSMSSQMQPFHPGLVHNYQTLVAKCHSCLAEMNFAKLGPQDAAVIDYHTAIITENLNKLLQQIAIASKSSFAMVNSDAGIRTKTSLIEALDILKRYKDAYNDRCKEAREMSKEIPMFDGISSTWTDFWSRFKYFVGDSPLPPIEKFHILSKHLEGRAKNFIAPLSFDNDSYQEAVTLLANFCDPK